MKYRPTEFSLFIHFHPFEMSYMCTRRFACDQHPRCLACTTDAKEVATMLDDAFQNLEDEIAHSLNDEDYYASVTYDKDDKSINVKYKSRSYRILITLEEMVPAPRLVGVEENPGPPGKASLPGMTFQCRCRGRPCQCHLLHSKLAYCKECAKIEGFALCRSCSSLLAKLNIK
jgi:hypothetical protein